MSKFKQLTLESQVIDSQIDRTYTVMALPTTTRLLNGIPVYLLSDRFGNSLVVTEEEVQSKRFMKV